MTDIIDEIPQKKPILLIDRFYGISEDGVSRTSYTIEESNIFLDGQTFSACGVIEHMAQSAAVRNAWTGKLKGTHHHTGYIGSISRFKMPACVYVKDTIDTELEILQEFGNMSMVEARTYAKGVLVAEGRLGIVIAE